MFSYTPMTMMMIREILREAKEITDMGYGFIKFVKEQPRRGEEESDE